MTKNGAKADKEAAKNAAWLIDRVQFIKGKKKPTDQESLLVALAELENRDTDDEEKLQVLIQVIKYEQAAKNKMLEFSKLQNESDERDRKARTHELIQWGLVLVAAGWVDSKTGKQRTPHLTRESLAGAISGMVDMPVHHQKWADWNETGAEILRKSEKEKPPKRAKNETPQPQPVPVPEVQD